MSRRRRRVMLALGLIVCAIAAGSSIALAARSDAPAQVQVTSSALGGLSTTTAPDPTGVTGATGATGVTGATSTTTTTTTTTTSASSAPESVNGTYLGIEHFGFSTGACSFLEHHLAGSFVLADGTTWQFRQDYCGTLHGDSLWDGVGTFVLTGEDGASITGTVTETDIKVPSPGVPYTIVITGGTQRYAAASGSCRLDNHLRQVQFGLQDDYGTFACDIHV